MHPNESNSKRPPKETEPSPKRPLDQWRRWLWPALLLFFLIWTVLSSGSLMNSSQDDSAVEVPYSTVRNQAVSNIKQIEIDSTGIMARGEFTRPITVEKEDGSSVQAEKFTTTLPPGSATILQEIFRSENPDALVEGNPPQQLPLLLQILIQFSPILIIVAFLFWMSRRAQGQMGNVFSFGRSTAREYDTERPQVTFVDVAGQDAAKAELIEVVDFLKNPDKYIQLGARVPRGVLLVGPPGTGKTLMARAVAGEANCAFFSIAASEFVEMFVGVGASRVRDLFNRAKENAPAIVFIDEIDAVGRQRGAGMGGGNDEREQTLNQMLSELDGFEQDATVIVMAATNRPDVLDPALLRPGRFDRQITVELPDRAGRIDILKIHTRGKPLSSDLRLEHLAGATVGFSGADLANLCNEAALTAARNNRRKILQTDFTEAFERMILGTKRPPLSDLQERRIIAYHEAGHTLVSMLTPQANRILKSTIVPRGQALGVALTISDDLRNYPRKKLEAHIRVGLGGRVAEEIVFEDVTTGATGDIQMVTNIARRMVTQFGMSALGMLNFGNDAEHPFLGYALSQGRSYSEETAARIDSEVKKIVDHAYEETRLLILANREKLDEIAQALLDNEVVERPQLLEIMGMEDDISEDDKVVLVAPDAFPPEIGHGIDKPDIQPDITPETPPTP